jgi:general secretion pathway protein A
MREDPFAGRPSGAALYCRTTQRDLLSAIRTGLVHGNRAVRLTGPEGCGKTVLCRLLLRALPANVDLLLVTRPPAHLREFLRRILTPPKFNDPGPDASVQELVDHLRQVFQRGRARGRLPVLIIDDAQELHPDTEDALLHLRSRGSDGDPLFALLLSGRGRPAPASRPRNDGTRHVEMAAFSPAESADYVRHRLRSVGGSAHLFTEGALREVHKHSAGLPRRIDILCGHALLGAFFAGAETVDWNMVRGTIRGDGDSQAPAAGPWPHWAKVASIFGAAFTGTLLLTLWWANLATVEFGEPAPAPATIESRELAPANEPASTPMAPAVASPDRVARLGAPVSPDLATLSDNEDTVRARAEHRLLARWQADGDAAASQPVCSKNRTLRCLQGRGGWGDIERLNRPALLRLGAAHTRAAHVVVVGLEGDNVRVDIGGREYLYPRAQLDRHWQGVYTVLWRPPVDGVDVIGRGAPRAALDWLRAALARIEGRPVPVADADAYDWPLTKRVMEFQRSVGLKPDGTVGAATVIALQTALRAPNTPLLVAGR